jgi:hypothetical protein
LLRVSLRSSLPLSLAGFAVNSAALSLAVSGAPDAKAADVERGEVFGRAEIPRQGRHPPAEWIKRYCWLRHRRANHLLLRTESSIARTKGGEDMVLTFWERGGSTRPVAILYNTLHESVEHIHQLVQATCFGARVEAT